MSQTPTTSPISEDEISLVDILRPLWQNRKLLWRSGVVGIVLGVLVALLTPNEYSANSVFVPNYGGQSGPSSSSLMGLASLAGFDLGGIESGAKELSPMLYGQIIQGVTFNKQLLNSKMYIEGDSVSVQQYLLDRPGSAIGWVSSIPGKLIGLFKSEKESSASGLTGIETLSQEESDLIEELFEIISLSVNDQDGYIELSATTGDPLVSAQLTSIVQGLLQDQIIAIKTQSSKELVEYLNQLFNEKKALLSQAQDQLSNFKDKNITISSFSFSNQQTRLETDLQIAAGVFQSVSGQLEQAKLQLEKDTPVFSVIRPVSVPVEKSAPKRSLIVLIWGFLTVVLSAGFVLTRSSVKELFIEIKQ